MTDQTPAQILHVNRFDDAAVTASSWPASAEPALLQNPHIGRKWKGRNGDTETIDFDLGSSLTSDVLSMQGLQAIFPSGDQLNMNSAALLGISLSNVAIGSSDVLLLSPTAGLISEAYGSFVYKLASTLSFRYGRISLSQPSATALLAGRGIVGELDQFQLNYSYGWARGWGDNSRKKKAAGGQTFIERDDMFRLLNVTFGMIERDDVNGFVEEIDRLNGLHDDILFITNPDSDNLPRDSLWGLMTDLSPPTQPFLDHFAKLYQMEGRL